MEHRIEPRSQVSLPIRVILPGPPAEELGCRLIDVSATGVRFESDVTLVLDEMVAIEIEDQLVLAEIRHCRPEGDKFIAGARRLHQVAKRFQLGDMGAYVSEMIEDLERRVLAGEEPASRMLALEALDRIVEKAHGGAVTQTLPEIAASQVAAKPEPQLAAVKLPALVGPPPEEKKEPAKKSWRIPLAAAAALVLAVVGTIAVVERGVVAKTPNPVAAAPAVAAVTVPPAPPAARVSSAPKATEVVPANPVKATPVQTSSAPAASTPKAPAAVVPASPVKTSPAPVIPAKPQPVAAATPGAHHARVNVLEASWVSIVSDVKSTPGQVMHKGEVMDFEFKDRALLHIGYGAGVEISVDGRSIGPIGGALRMLELTPAGKRFLPYQNETH